MSGKGWTVKRNRRAGVEDRWTKTVRDPDGTTRTEQSANYGKGSRWRARYVDDTGKEHAKGFSRKVDAQQWLNKQVSDQVTGTWTDPALSGVTFGEMAQRWISTKVTRAAKTVAGYESLLETLILPRWENVALREVSFDDLRVDFQPIGGRVSSLPGQGIICLTGSTGPPGDRCRIEVRRQSQTPGHQSG